MLKEIYKNKKRNCVICGRVDGRIFWNRFIKIKKYKVIFIYRFLLYGRDFRVLFLFLFILEWIFSICCFMIEFYILRVVNI